jgi:hypothetical protein
MLVSYAWHCTWVTSEAYRYVLFLLFDLNFISSVYSSPSIVLAARSGDGGKIIFDDFREAYYWLRQNTEEVYCFDVIIVFKNYCISLFVLIGCKSDVVVGLWLSNNGNGKSYNLG